jgi:predicted transcriptional regulator
MARAGLRAWLAAARGELGAVFGDLELRVLDALWRRGSGHTVRELTAEFPGTAYTTLLTTLERLYRKGVLERERHGRAFRYRPKYTREALKATFAHEALATLLEGDARPVLSSLVDLVSARDRRLLGELEALVRARRERRTS